MVDIDVVAYLASKGYTGKQANGPEVAYPCFFDCGEDSRSRKRKLYLNTEDGFYVCFVCGAAGGTYLLQKHFGDEPRKPTPGSDPYVRRRILNWAAEVASIWLTNNDDQLLWLINERGLSPETIIERRLGLVVPPWSLTGNLPEEFTRDELANTGLVWSEGTRRGDNYFYNHLMVPYIERGNVVSMRGRLVNGVGPKYLTGQGDPTRLYNIDSLDGADEVIITEAELDAAVVHQHLRGASDDRVRRIAVVGLSGINGFPDGAESYLANIKRIHIGFDPDDAGWRGAEKLKARFGTRARILGLPDDLPKADWSEFLLPVPAGAGEDWHAAHPHAGHDWQDIVSLISNASGKRVYTMREAGFAYRQQLAENPKGGIKFGYRKIDEKLLGVTPGKIVIVLAKTGTGKTNFLVNVAWANRDEPQLFVSLEQTREEVYERLRRVALFWNERWTDDQVEAALSNILICDENRLTEKDFLDLLDEFEVEMGCRPKIIHVDYLGYLARGVAGINQYEKVSGAAMMLKAVAKDRKNPCVLIVPAQVNRGSEQGKRLDIDAARESGVIEETADVLIGMYRPDLAELDKIQDETRSAISRPILTGTIKYEVLKVRGPGQGLISQAQFDSLTLALVGQEDDGYHRAKEHFNEECAGMTYDQLRKYQLRPIQSSLL